MTPWQPVDLRTGVMHDAPPPISPARIESHLIRYGFIKESNSTQPDGAHVLRILDVAQKEDHT